MSKSAAMAFSVRTGVFGDHGAAVERIAILKVGDDLHRRPRRLALRGLALVGEAGGIDATTGEGIAQAILMGGIAGRHLARALRLGDGRLDGYGAEVVGTTVGRHLLQSAWLARHVYGARGASWRAFLAREPSALEAGARWYAGERLGWAAKARLGARLAVALARSRDAV